MLALRHHLPRQPVGPSHEQAVQAPCDGGQASVPIPEGKYVPGAYVPDRMVQTDRRLRCELRKKTLTTESLLPDIHLRRPARTTQLQTRIRTRHSAIHSGIRTYLYCPCEQRGGLSLERDGRAWIRKAVSQRTTTRRQYGRSTHYGQQHVQLTHETHRPTVIFFLKS